MKRVCPSPSFEILLPDTVVYQTDQQVSSFWLSGNPVLLQLSSYRVKLSRPMAARLRLKERIAKSAGQWNVWESSPLCIDFAEQAIADTVDSDGLLWIHAYIVWSHVTVYATISGPGDDVRNSKNWALRALESIRPTVKQ